MEKSNNIIRRIICVVLALTLTACIFTSCKKNNEEEEITRGNAQIERPTNEEESQPEGEATTDPAATMKDVRNTTAKASDNAATEGTTYSSDPKVDGAIKDAAKQSGMSPEQIAEFIQIMGYDYDPVQGIFYTSLNNWQRQANFVSHYDTAAHYFTTAQQELTSVLSTVLTGEFSFGRVSTVPSAEVKSVYIRKTRSRTLCFITVPTMNISSIWSPHFISIKRIIKTTRFTLQENGRLIGGLQALSRAL